MIRFERSGRAKIGRIMEGVRSAKEIADYINQKYAPISVQVYTEQFGNVGMIHWQVDYRDLAAYEALANKLLEDKGYWAAVNKAMEFFIDGSFRDCLLSSV